MKKSRHTRKNGESPGNTIGRSITLEIVRCRPGETQSYRQSFSYVIRDAADTVATALQDLTGRAALSDTDGHPAEPVIWECSCLQKKCGACAMLVNGKPRLACDSFLRELPERVELAPLRKFPVIADLLVDRDVMRRNLREMRVWMERSARYQEKTAEDAYDASRCLQCGLCLEVCPNFEAGGTFTGAAGAMPASRVLLAQTEKKGDRKNRGTESVEEKPSGTGKEIGKKPAAQNTKTDRIGELRMQYQKRVFEGCGKSLACRYVCPAGIETGEQLAQSNAIVVWRRGRYQKA